MSDNGLARKRYEATVRLARECINRGLDIGGITDWGGGHYQTKRRGRRLDLGKEAGPSGGRRVRNAGYTSDMGRNLLK